MDEHDFAGSLILERLASLNLIDKFYEAVDSDDVNQVTSLLEEAGFDDDTIGIVLKKMDSFDT